MKKSVMFLLLSLVCLSGFRTKWESEKWGNRWCFDGLV